MKSETTLPTENVVGVDHPRLVRVIAWVEIMGKRAETTFDVESPWVCPGACPELQKRTDLAVANWVFQSHAKSGFTVAPISDPNRDERCGGQAKVSR